MARLRQPVHEGTDDAPPAEAVGAGDPVPVWQRDHARVQALVQLHAHLDLPAGRLADRAGAARQAEPRGVLGVDAESAVGVAPSPRRVPVDLVGVPGTPLPRDEGQRKLRAAPGLRLLR